ncbi:hypothetical protein BCR39DRAFT_561589 [Naematelia encephala]|uniref:Uncharacterized protein n=1 Tax=Naematelia encephala TaxID=71784 RepID=A0A1Y2ANZ9_9TREE|nr:hypothetical protein BCR39DRAFT_561589 [Naematelia encephala]
MQPADPQYEDILMEAVEHARPEIPFPYVQYTEHLSMEIFEAILRPLDPLKYPGPLAASLDGINSRVTEHEKEQGWLEAIAIDDDTQTVLKQAFKRQRKISQWNGLEKAVYKEEKLPALQSDARIHVVLTRKAIRETPNLNGSKKRHGPKTLSSLISEKSRHKCLELLPCQDVPEPDIDEDQVLRMRPELDFDTVAAVKVMRDKAVMALIAGTRRGRLPLEDDPVWDKWRVATEKASKAVPRPISPPIFTASSTVDPVWRPGLPREVNAAIKPIAGDYKRNTKMFAHAGGSAITPRGILARAGMYKTIKQGEQCAENPFSLDLLDEFDERPVDPLTPSTNITHVSSSKRPPLVVPENILTPTRKRKSWQRPELEVPLMPLSRVRPTLATPLRNSTIPPSFLASSPRYHSPSENVIMMCRKEVKPGKPSGEPTLFQAIQKRPISVPWEEIVDPDDPRYASKVDEEAHVYDSAPLDLANSQEGKQGLAGPFDSDNATGEQSMDLPNCVSDISKSVTSIYREAMPSIISGKLDWRPFMPQNEASLYDALLEDGIDNWLPELSVSQIDIPDRGDSPATSPAQGRVIALAEHALNTAMLPHNILSKSSRWDSGRREAILAGAGVYNELRQLASYTPANGRYAGVTKELDKNLEDADKFYFEKSSFTSATQGVQAIRSRTTPATREELGQRSVKRMKANMGNRLCATFEDKLKAPRPLEDLVFQKSEKSSAKRLASNSRDSPSNLDAIPEYLRLLERPELSSDRTHHKARPAAMPEATSQTINQENWKQNKIFQNPGWWLAATRKTAPIEPRLPVFAGLELLQHRSMRRALGLQGFELIERETSIQGADLVLSGHTAVLFRKVVDLSDTKQQQDIIAALETTSTFFRRIMLILEVIPYALHEKGNPAAPLPIILTPPLVKSISAFKRRVAIECAPGVHDVVALPSVIFALGPASEVACGLRTIAEEELDTLRTEGKTGKIEEMERRVWLKVNESEGEIKLNQFGLNSFASNYILGQCDMSRFLHLKDCEQDEMLGPVASRAVIDRFRRSFNSQRQDDRLKPGEGSSMDLPKRPNGLIESDCR